MKGIILGLAFVVSLSIAGQQSAGNSSHETPPKVKTELGTIRQGMGGNRPGLPPGLLLTRTYQPTYIFSRMSQPL